jgi:hypothetical protein
LRPVHRHNEGARELPIGWRSSTIAVALRLAVSIRWSVASDAVEMVPTGRRADCL